MPKLDATHIIERLSKRIVQLEAGEALEARDINSLLTAEQQQELKTAWATQQQLRKSYKTLADAERDGHSWKTIREVRLDVYRHALGQAQINLPGAFNKMLHDVEIRSAKIYMAAFVEAQNGHQNPHIAANNALTQAGLRRMDRPSRGVGNRRDREIWAMEDKIREMLRAKMSADDLEQLDLAKEHDEAVRKRLEKGKEGRFIKKQGFLGRK